MWRHTSSTRTSVPCPHLSSLHPELVGVQRHSERVCREEGKTEKRTDSTEKKVKIAFGEEVKKALFRK